MRQKNSLIITAILLSLTVLVQCSSKKKTDESSDSPLGAVEKKSEVENDSPRARKFKDVADKYRLSKAHILEVSEDGEFRSKIGSQNRFKVTQSMGALTPLITSLVIYRLIDRGVFSLNTKLYKVAPFTETELPKSAWRITIGDLLYARAPIMPKHPCMKNVFQTLSTCSLKILKVPAKTEKNKSDFSRLRISHWHLLAWAAEKATDKKWQQIFEDEIIRPLEISFNNSSQYYTYPGKRIGIVNPRPAGGLVLTMEVYVDILKSVLNSLYSGTGNFISSRTTKNYLKLLASWNKTDDDSKLIIFQTSKSYSWIDRNKKSVGALFFSPQAGGSGVTGRRIYGEL